MWTRMEEYLKNQRNLQSTVENEMSSQQSSLLDDTLDVSHGTWKAMLTGG